MENNNFEESVRKLDLKSVMVGSILAALGFLVAFSWRDFIQHILNTFIPPSDNLFYQFLATMIITLMALFLGYVIVKISQKSIRETFRRKKSYRISGKMKVKPI